VKSVIAFRDLRKIRPSDELLRLLIDFNEERSARSRQVIGELAKLTQPAETLSRALEPLRRGILDSAMVSRLDSLTGVLGTSGQLAEAMKASLGASRAIQDALKPMNSAGVFHDAARSFSALRPAILEHHRLISDQLALRESTLSGLRTGFAGLLGIQAPLAPHFAEALRESQSSWAKSLQDLVRPFGADGLLGSLASAQRGLSWSARLTAAAALSPGFTTVANLGLAGAAAQGVVADVLRNYGDPSDRFNDVFREALRTARLVDDEADDADYEEAIQSAWKKGRSRWDLRDPAQASVLLSIVTLLLMIYQTRLNYDALQVARSSATSADIVELQSEVKRVGDALLRNRDAGDVNWANIRYVSGPAPLRAEAHGKGALLATVYPDQLIKVLKARGQWASVEVIGYSGTAEIRGWINRRHLRASTERH
jgi:hypothetical protein